MKGGEHGLQACEVSSPCRDNQRGVEQFSMELLCFEEVVHMHSLPCCDGYQVFHALLLR